MNYVRIDFKNLTDYDYTIVPTWSDAMDYVESMEDNYMLMDDKDFKECEKQKLLPEMKLTLVNLTNDQYEKWFRKNVKP